MTKLKQMKIAVLIITFLIAASAFAATGKPVPTRAAMKPCKA